MDIAKTKVIKKWNFFETFSLQEWENFRNSESYVEEDKSLKEKADYERLLNRNKLIPRKGDDGCARGNSSSKVSRR